MLGKEATGNGLPVGEQSAKGFALEAKPYFPFPFSFVCSNYGCSHYLYECPIPALCWISELGCGRGLTCATGQEQRCILTTVPKLSSFCKAVRKHSNGLAAEGEL